MKTKKPVLYCIIIAVALRLFYLVTPQLDSDKAVIGLAARHILKGEFPLFFYGTPFEGIIEGYLAAPLFFLFGSSRFVLNCVPAIMSLVLIYAVYKLAKTIFGDLTAYLTLLFSAIAPPYFIVSTTVPMEGYIETAILGAIAFIITYKIIYIPQGLSRLYLLLGFVIGFAFYLHFHIIPFFITIAILLFLNDKKIILKKYLLFSIVGFLFGNLPLLAYNITHRWETFGEIGRGIENSTFIGTLKHLFGYGYWVILGAKADRATTPYIPYISGLIMLIYLGSFIYVIRKKKKGAELLITLLIVFPITYWLSGRGEVNTRRYLIPLYAVTPILLGYFLSGIRDKYRILFYSLTIFILGYNLYTNFVSITLFNPYERIRYRSETQRDNHLYNFLKTNKINGAYTLFWWISLKINFDFKEDIIFNLALDEPYPKYQKSVDVQPNPAFVGYFSELAPTFDSIGGSYKTEWIPAPMSCIPPYSIQYGFKPVEQTLEEIDNTNLSVNSSHNTESSALAIDRDISTRWHSDTAQRNGMSFTIDLGRTYTKVTRLIYHPGPPTDWPCGYELYTSLDGNNWRCVAKNPACITPVFWNGPHPFIRSINGLIEIDFPPRPVRYLKIILTKDKERFYWSIAETYIYRQKDKTANDWNITKLLERLSKIKSEKIYADPWITSHIDNKFYAITKHDTIDNNYLYKYFVIEPYRLKDCIFIVLQENYPSFIKTLGGIRFNMEDFGPYILVTFCENTNSPLKLYWDGFHLLKCAY